MGKQSPANVAAPVLAHGAARLSAVEVADYNVELKDDEGFIGDRASKGAFRKFIENWRKPLRDLDHDPFGDEPSSKIAKKKLDQLLASGDPETAGIIQSAIESFAQELAVVLRRFLKLKGWKDASRLVIGGGFVGSRVGELAIGRASVLLKADKIDTEICIIRNDPDEAGLLGATQLAPAWMFEAHDAILAVDIGGTNIRAGVVQLNLRGASDLSKAKVWKFELWRHGDEKLNREEAVDGLISMLQRLINRAKKEDLRLAPFIGIGCPGKIDADGSIEAGAQEFARELGKQPLQSAESVVRGDPAHRRPRDRNPDAQRCRGARPKRSSVRERRRDLGDVHHRHGPRQRVVRQPRAMMSSAAVIAGNESDEAIQD